MAGGGRHSPPPTLENSLVTRDVVQNFNGKDKAGQGDEVRRSDRLRRSSRINRDPRGNEEISYDGSGGSSSQDMEILVDENPSLSQQRISPLHDQTILGNHLISDLRSDSPQNGLMKDEEMPSIEVAVHNKQNLNGKNEVPLRNADAIAAPKSMEMHGKVHIIDGMNQISHAAKDGCLTPTEPSKVSSPSPKLNIPSSPSYMGTLLDDGIRPRHGPGSLFGDYPNSHAIGLESSSLLGRGPSNSPLPSTTKGTLPAATPPNAWKPRKGFKFLELEPLKNILGEDGVSIKMDGIESGNCLTRLEGAIVAKIIGKPLPLPFLTRELQRRWAKFGRFQISPMGRDSFICIFESQEARDAVLCGGPWFVGGQLIGMDLWNPRFNPSSFNGITSPVWIRLPELPLQYWSPKNIGRIATKIGVPLWIDDFTINWERLEYARVCVKVDFSQSLPNGVWLQGSDENEKFFQPFVYEGITQLCFNCGRVGHIDTYCTLGTASNPSNQNASSTVLPKVVSNEHKNLKPSTTNLNKASRWVDLAESATIMPPSPIPSNLEVHKSTPLPSRPSPQKGVQGNHTRVDDSKRPPLLAAPPHEDMGYGPWTLVTYRKKKVPPQKKPQSSQHISHGSDAEPHSSKSRDQRPPLLSRPPTKNAVSPKPLIFSASLKEPQDREATSSKQKGKAWKPKLSSSNPKASASTSMGPVIMVDLDLDNNRKRKKRNVTVEFDGGDASPLVN